MLSIVIPHYQNNELALRQLEDRAALPADILGATELVLVDDGSSELLTVNPPPGTLLARIHQDIPWNQPGARNLGVHLARNDWLLLTDIDHLFPAESLAAIVESLPSLSRRWCYRFNYRPGEGNPPLPHINTLLLRRDAFWQVGGADEDFSGHYGHDDVIFDWRWRKAGRGFRIHPTAQCTLFADGWTRRLDRDTSRNERLMRKKKAERQYIAPSPRLRFNWSAEGRHDAPPRHDAEVHSGQNWLRHAWDGLACRAARLCKRAWLARPALHRPD